MPWITFLKRGFSQSCIATSMAWKRGMPALVWKAIMVQNSMRSRRLASPQEASQLFGPMRGLACTMSGWDSAWSSQWPVDLRRSSSADSLAAAIIPETHWPWLSTPRYWKTGMVLLFHEARGVEQFLQSGEALEHFVQAVLEHGAHPALAGEAEIFRRARTVDDRLMKALVDHHEFEDAAAALVTAILAVGATRTLPQLQLRAGRRLDA